MRTQVEIYKDLEAIHPDLVGFQFNEFEEAELLFEERGPMTTSEFIVGSPTRDLMEELEWAQDEIPD